MEMFIRFVLSNFTLTFLVLGLLASAIALWRRPRPLTAAAVIEELFTWFLFFSIGISFLYNFVFHTFFGEMAARHIGCSLAQAATATAKLAEIDKQLGGLKGDGRLDRARGYVREQIKKIKLASIEAI